MAGASVLGGLTEAVFLVVVTRAAFAITEGKHEMGLLAGHSVAVSTALLLALALVVFRIGMAVASNWSAATLNAQVTTDLRRRLAHAFLRSSWAVQQLSPAGRLQ